VAAAKAQGWDGKVRVLFANSPIGQTTGLVIDTQLRAAGMDPQLDISKTSAQMTVQYTQQRDFDVVGTGFAASNDEGGFVAFNQNLLSTAASNRIGFKDAGVDAALVAIRLAVTDDARKAAFARLATAIYASAPMVVYGKIDQLVAYSPKVHGLTPTMRDSVTFTKAWMEK
jgi:peptide/nickel transport system substrate-binding protein